MTALVTGATGFVGRRVVEDLLLAGGRVRALVRDPGAAAGLRESGAEIVLGDARDVEVMRRAMRGVDTTYHCAAAIGQPPRLFAWDIHRLNMSAARALFEAAHAERSGRVVLLSTVNVFGTRNLDNATEDLPLRSSKDALADVKISIEKLARHYEQQHGIDVTIVRPGLIYGPRDRVNLPRIIGALSKRSFAYIGSRDNVVPIVHVADVARAMMLAGRTPAARGRAYNITDGGRTTIGEFIDYLCHLLGCPRPTTVLPYAAGEAVCLFIDLAIATGLGPFLARAGIYRDPPLLARNSLRFLGTSRSFNLRRAREELGYEPTVDYREGLADAVRWLKEPVTRLTSLPRLDRDELKTRVEEAIYRHWVSPAPSQVIDVPAPAEVEPLSKKVLDTLLTRQFRVGRLPDPQVYEQLLERVRLRVRKGEPVYVTVGFGPLKNQSAVDYSRADWAEFFALCHLVAWHNKVQKVYAPGLRLQVVFDNSTLARANNVDHKIMDSYMDSVADLIQALGFDAVFRFPAMQSSVTWLFHLGLYQLADWRVSRWERDPANREQVEKMVQFARRNVVVPADLPARDHDRYLREASHRFRVCWEAMQLSGLPRSKGHLLAVYLDGTQHHFSGVNLHLTTLDKGQITQPWQGEGALLDNGHGGLEPFVITSGRRGHYRTRTVEGLDILPLPGFDRLKVALAEVAAPATQTATVTNPAHAATGESGSL